MLKEKFKKEIEVAVGKYGEDNVDIIVEGDKVHGTYHSSADSFAVTGEYSLKGIGGMESVDELLEAYGVGLSE